MEHSSRTKPVLDYLNGYSRGSLPQAPDAIARMGEQNRAKVCINPHTKTPSRVHHSDFGVNRPMQNEIQWHAG